MSERPTELRPSHTGVLRLLRERDEKITQLEGHLERFDQWFRDPQNHLDFDPSSNTPFELWNGDDFFASGETFLELIAILSLEEQP